MKLWAKFVDWIAGEHGWLIADDPDDHILKQYRNSGMDWNEWSERTRIYPFGASIGLVSVATDPEEVEDGV